MLTAATSPETEKTARAFGWQWQHFVEMHNLYEEQFLDWIAPIGPAFFRDKVVLDAGCGNGRHAYFAAQYGSREVIALDVSAAVDTAQRNIGGLPGVHVVQADICNPPFRRSPDGGPFDFVYSIGVLHHLPDPEAGFHSLVRLVRPGGHLFAWVYGRENNQVVHRVIDPLRRHVTTRLPPSLMRALAWPLAVAFHVVVKGVYRPLGGTAWIDRLPSGHYIYSLRKFNFQQNYNIVFDQLVAPMAHYLTREEYEAWFRHAGLSEVQLSWRNQNSWRGLGSVSHGSAV